MFNARFQQWFRTGAQRAAGHLAGLPVTPDQVTVVGTLVVFGAGLLAGLNLLLAAGLVLAAGGLFDVLDGALARASSRARPFGAFLDSTTDRYAEGAVYIGIAVHYLGQPNARAAVAGTLLAMMGSFAVSYTKARAQSLGFRSEKGFFARPERMVALVVGLLLGGPILLAVVWALAVLTNLTALQRIREVWLQARDPRPAAAEKTMLEPPSAGKPAGAAAALARQSEPSRSR